MDFVEQHGKCYYKCMQFYEYSKAYDTVNGKALLKALTLYDMHGRLVNDGKSFYKGSGVCVRVSGGMSEWLKIDVKVH